MEIQLEEMFLKTWTWRKSVDGKETWSQTPSLLLPCKTICNCKISFAWWFGHITVQNNYSMLCFLKPSSSRNSKGLWITFSRKYCLKNRKFILKTLIHSIKNTMGNKLQNESLAGINLGEIETKNGYDDGVVFCGLFLHPIQFLMSI